MHTEHITHPAVTISLSNIHFTFCLGWGIAFDDKIGDDDSLDLRRPDDSGAPADRLRETPDRSA